MADYFVIIKETLSLPFAALLKINSITYWSNVSKNLITLTHDDDKKKRNNSLQNNTTVKFRKRYYRLSYEMGQEGEEKM